MCKCKMASKRTVLNTVVAVGGWLIKLFTEHLYQPAFNTDNIHVPQYEGHPIKSGIFLKM